VRAVADRRDSPLGHRPSLHPVRSSSPNFTPEEVTSVGVPGPAVLVLRLNGAIAFRETYDIGQCSAVPSLPSRHAAGKMANAADDLKT
jgi:hypothetical protein